MPIIDLELDSSGAIKSLKEYDGAVDNSAKATDSGFSKMSASVAGLAKVIGAGVVAGVGAATTGFIAFSAALSVAGEKARDVENLARLAGLSVEEFQNAAKATEKFGINAEALGDISKDVQDKLGDFIATGGGEFADFFENVAPKVGLTAEALAKMSGPDALIAVKKAMDDANVSAAEQVFYLESLGNDLTKLNPLLENNGELWKKTAADAEALGTALSQIQIDNLTKGADSVKQITSLVTALKDKVIANLAPEFAKFTDQLIQGFKDTGLTVDDVAKKISDGLVGSMNFLVERTTAWVDLWNRVSETTDEWQMQSQVNDLREKLGKANEALQLAEEGWFGMGKAADSVIKKARQDVQNLERDIATLETTGKTSLTAFVDSVNTAIEKTGTLETNLGKVEKEIEKVGNSGQTIENINGVWTSINTNANAAADAIGLVSANIGGVAESTQKMVEVNGVWKATATDAESAAFDIKAVKLATDLQTDATKKAAEEEKELAEKTKEATAAAMASTNAFKQQAAAVDDVADSANRLDSFFEERRSGRSEGNSDGGGYDAGGSGAGGSFSGTTSAHGDTLSNEEWQGLPKYMQDFLSKSVTEGSSSYDYFSNSSGNRFSGEQGFTQDWAGVVAQGAANQQSMITNNFNQSISRSDITGIIEETARTEART